jgi:hypothetical protein
VPRLPGGVTPATALAALLAGAVAFGGSFAAARALSSNDESHEAVVKRQPERLVTISNLERAPSIKPLRSAAGAAPPAQPTGTP